MRERSAAFTGGSPPAGATQTALARVEAALGVKLPTTYRAFAKAAGSASWPVEVFDAERLVRGGGFGQSEWFVAFATDGAGNDWGFDVRAMTRGEYPILFWDHEEPPPAEELAEPGLAVRFDDWLGELVSGELATERAASDEEPWTRVAAALDARRCGVFPYAPALDDVRAVEGRLARALPPDYVQFTTRFGSTDWPFAIVDAQEVEALTEAMHREHPALRDAVAFGHDVVGAFLAFRRDVVVNASGKVAPSFLALLEAKIGERSLLVLPDAPTSEARTPRQASADVPDAIQDERARAIFRACAVSRSYGATVMQDGRIQVSIDDFEGGRRRSFLDPGTWALLERHLRAAPEG